MLKDADILGSGHIFVAGLINDVVMGLPLGVSPISYLVVAFFASYVKNVTVNTSLFTDWFTFFLAVFFSNIVFLIFLINFTEIQVKYIDIFYNSFFTILFYPFFWLIFNIYKTMMLIKQDG
jgi:cell shape-determining protein MreD